VAERSVPSGRGEAGTPGWGGEGSGEQREGEVRFSYAGGAAGQWAAWLTPVDKYYLWAPSMCWVVRCSVVF
jgi:hypothetical protein